MFSLSVEYLAFDIDLIANFSIEFSSGFSTLFFSLDHLLMRKGFFHLR